jgi:DNA replication protein DnaC
MAPVAKQAKNVPNCPVCGDTGWKTVSSGKDRRVARCDCAARSRADLLLSQAHIPPRYQGCDLASYATDGLQRGVAAGKLAVAKFVEQYPLDKAGLMLIGPFCDYRELLKQIQNSYNPSVQTTELELLQPVFQTEVLVLDDLGAVKPTEWVWDTVSVILNTRYNETRTTIITTNFQDGPATALAGPRGAAREETLGDRIGERMRSRLSEMCRVIHLNAPDYRQKFRAAGLK